MKCSFQGVQIQNFMMPGKKILDLGRECFLTRAPPYMGDILWEHLEILQKGRPNFILLTIFIDFWC